MGACGTRTLVVTGPRFRQTDLRLAKRTRIVGNTSFEIGFEMLNAFNQANFVPVTGFANPNTTNSNNNNGFFNSSGAAIKQLRIDRLNRHEHVASIADHESLQLVRVVVSG
jgi:hypothetical protein